MKDDLSVKNGIVIPGHEIEITASRAGGPGGQHVNKTSTKITVRWNVPKTTALNDEQKDLVMQNLQARLSSEGDLIIHNAASRSQQQNKENALANLAGIVRKALFVHKKRMKTRTPKKVKETRLKEKAHRSEIKKMRSKKFQDD